MRALVLGLAPVGSPEAARRLAGRGLQALTDEPLLGNVAQWQDWFALDGLAPRINPVAAFNDAGRILPASEQGLGICLVRKLLAADALVAGKQQRLSPRRLPKEGHDGQWLVCPAQPGRLATAAIAAQLAACRAGAV